MKDRHNKDKKILFKFERELEEKKKLPKEDKNKIKFCILKGIISFVLILIYLIIIKVLEENIPTNVYLICLKVFSIVLCVATIVIIEIAYKKNSNKLILSSLEIIIITFFTVFLISAYSIYYGQLYKFIIIALIIIAIYYLIKTIVILRMIKVQYFRSLNDIKTIVAKK